MLFLPLRPSLYGLCPVRLSVPVFNQSKSAQCHQRAHWHFWPTFLSFHIYTVSGIEGISKGAKMYKKMNLYTVRFLIYVLVLQMLKPTFFLPNFFSRYKQKKNPPLFPLFHLTNFKYCPNSRYNLNSVYKRIQIFPAILSLANFRAGWIVESRFSVIFANLKWI